LPMTEVEKAIPIGPGLGSTVEITHGSITYQSDFKPLSELKTSVIGGYVKRNDTGKLEAYIQTDVSVLSLQRLNEKLGLNSMRLLSKSEFISEEPDNPIIFTSTTNHILPQGESVLNLLTWEEIRLPIDIHVQTQTTASGHLKSKVFQGKFEAIFTYDEIGPPAKLNGDFQIHLA